MKASTKIVVAVTAWLAVGSLFLLRTILVDRAELNLEQLRRYEALTHDPLLTGIRIAVTDSQVPDMAAAAQHVVNGKLQQMDSPFRFFVDTQCTADVEMCVEATPGDADILELDSGKHTLKVTYREETMIKDRTAEAVAMLLLEHAYKSEVIPSHEVEHEEVTVSYSPQYQITFSLFSEKGASLDWNITSAINKQLGPLLKVLNNEVAVLTVDSQTGLYANMGAVPHQNDKERILDRTQLSTFVDFAEWKLASLLPYPTLNFVLYVPDSPLKIKDTTKAMPQFIVPQWGGVIISEPHAEPHTFSETELQPILDVFARQLLALLGMREPTNQQRASHASTEVLLARLSRQSARRGILGAASSLGSLRRLAATMQNIAIPQQVAQRAEETMREIDDAIALLAKGEHAAAAASARRAYSAADRAFFDKHMVAQAYFPDEHKVAVYMPLIGPLFVVVLSGWLRFIKQKKAQRRNAQLKEKSTQSEKSVPQ